MRRDAIGANDGHAPNTQTGDGQSVTAGYLATARPV